MVGAAFETKNLSTIERVIPHHAHGRPRNGSFRMLLSLSASRGTINPFPLNQAIVLKADLVAVHSLLLYHVDNSISFAFRSAPLKTDDEEESNPKFPGCFYPSNIPSRIPERILRNTESGSWQRRRGGLQQTDKKISSAFDSSLDPATHDSRSDIAVAINGYTRFSVRACGE